MPFLVLCGPSECENSTYRKMSFAEEKLSKIKFKKEELDENFTSNEGDSSLGIGIHIRFS